MAEMWRPVAGVPVRVEFAPRRSGRGCWQGGTIRIILPGGLPRRENDRLLGLLAWGVLGRGVSPALAAWARHLNDEHFGLLPLEAAGFRHQMRRWGSCTAGRRIHLSHRLLVAPPDLVRGVLLHELAHLDQLNHGRQFWRTLAAADPDYRLRRRELGLFAPVWAAWWRGHLHALAKAGWTCLNPPG